jgi:hypothetical protein
LDQAYRKGKITYFRVTINFANEQRWNAIGKCHCNQSLRVMNCLILCFPIATANYLKLFLSFMFLFCYFRANL